MKKKTAVATGAAVLMLLGAGVASADIGGTFPTGTFHGTIKNPNVAAQDGVALLTKGNTEVTSLVKEYPGAPSAKADSGWHHHPGIVIATVQSGNVERLVLKSNGKCTYETFGPGDSFTEVEPHRVRNATALDAAGVQPSAFLSITAIHPDDPTLTFGNPDVTPTSPTCKFAGEK